MKMVVDNMYVALDIGGTKIEAMLADSRGRVLSGKRFPTQDNKGKKVVLGNIFNAIASVMERRKISAIGVGIAGFLDKKNHMLIRSPNIPSLNNVDLRRMISKRFGVPVFLQNDAKCFALSEFYFGAGKGSVSLVGVIWGTGVGSGLIIDGRLVNGCSNLAGEIGHAVLIEDGERCSCGKRGHLEQYTAARALVKRYKEFSGSKKSVSTKDIVRLSRKDKFARDAIDSIAYYMGLGLANLVQHVDPEVIVIGGGLSNVSQLFPKVRRVLKRNIQGQRVKVVRSKLGDSSGIYGALVLAMRQGEV